MKNFKNSIKKLEDVALDSIFGGGNGKKRIFGGLSLMGVAVLSNIGCEIASTAFKNKSKNEREHGNVESAEKFEKISRIVSTTGKAFSGCAVIAGGASAALGSLRYAGGIELLPESLANL